MSSILSDYKPSCSETSLIRRYLISNNSQLNALSPLPIARLRCVPVARLPIKMSFTYLRNTMMRSRAFSRCYRQTSVLGFSRNSAKIELRRSSTSASSHAPGVAQGWSQRRKLFALTLAGAIGALVGAYASRSSPRGLRSFFGIKHDLERLDHKLYELEKEHGKSVSKELLDAFKQDVSDLRILYTSALIEKVNRDLGGGVTASNSLLRKKKAEFAHSTRLVDTMKPVVINGSATVNVHRRWNDVWL